jgi:hypothetical protein
LLQRCPKPVQHGACRKRQLSQQGIFFGAIRAMSCCRFARLLLQHHGVVPEEG